ncbi:phosphoglycerate mutase/6-phosphofructo-2-kinase family [Schizosaccharomyces osmophilus]|uniref:Phosphoglycerate mutase/6-phosphofructo-2-kinase family n=1 Tax=Schizosaccharomyces osmophilus TaxID=2545709 RepID=A0AAF0AYK6_9SCHI|nr:phosphoglycerate mutase/6-phosphofructo-2-kinase family [Schizosaccharomyces osmophilus]WBW74718.1 phosphoglycerate mutase/6-phosphofructo-2-kinase family [Schizosaccharomyces osmophilus]
MDSSEHSPVLSPFDYAEEEPLAEVSLRKQSESWRLISPIRDISSTGNRDLPGVQLKKFTCLLVRHAESEHNVRGIRAGSIDSELTIHGYNQAKKLAKSLKEQRVRCIYSSPQTRAQRTALEIAKVTNCPNFTSSLLREKDLGSLEGTSFRFTANYRPNEAPMKVHGLENRDSLVHRAREFAESLLMEAEETGLDASDVVVIVSHGLFLPFLLRAILAAVRTPLPSKILPWSNASYTSIAIDLEGNTTVEMNLNSHLRGVRRVRNIGSTTYDSKQKPITEFCRRVD